MARAGWERYAAAALLALALGVSAVAARATETKETGTEAAQQSPLRSLGITPNLTLFGIYMANPSMGQKTGMDEAAAILSFGADFDLNKLMGFHGASLHFEGIYVPTPHNNGTFGRGVGDVLIGHAGPFIPKRWHLTQLTYEQKLLDNRLDFSIGVDNAGKYFGVAMCNQFFLCQGSTLMNGVGMNPPPYSNLSARAAFHLTPELTAQIGFWRDNAAFPFSTGLQGWGGTVVTPDGVTIQKPNSSLYLANLVYATDPKTDLYPRRYEVMLYHNNAVQTDPASGATHKGTSGIYLGGRQTVWRASDSPDATSVALYSSFYQSFDKRNGFGVGNEVDAGLIVKGLFRSRPFDSYGLSFVRNHLTSSEQSYLVQQNGGNYTVGPNEYAVGLNANMALGDGKLFVQPWVNYVWNVNTFQNPGYSGNPKSGGAIGVNFMVPLGKMLGL
ncbi:carbohydrate porin [Thioclava sp. BHET1]|nr:carbohydrate porin [Thioclava sp. BHET1]